ncbi:hypothetical protein OROMI_007662 [Orobanche minor]
MFFKIRSSQEILKFRDGTPLEANEILTYIKEPSKRIEILKFRDGTPLEANEILTYIKEPSKRIVMPSQEMLKIRDGTPLEADEILTYIKGPRNVSVSYFSSKLDVSSNVLQKKRVARILFFKIRMARILFFKIRPSQEILKIHDGTLLEMPSQEILKIRDDVPSNVAKKKRVARILFFKIRPSREILKIRDGTPLELDVPSNIIHKKKVARILFFKIRPSQEILKIRDGTPFEAKEILTYIKSPRNGSVSYFSSNLYVPSNVAKKKRVARILFFKIRPSREILKIRDGTPLEAEEILTYIKSPRNGSVCYFSSKLNVPSNIVHKKKVARILFFKIRPSQEILKIRDGTPLEWSSQEILKIRDGTPLEKRMARILFFKIRPSREILKIRDGTPLEAEEILTYIKSPRNGSVCYFSSKLNVPSNVLHKKRVTRILFFKIRSSQEILKIRDGTPLEAEEILTYIKRPSKRIGFLLF